MTDTQDLKPAAYYLNNFVKVGKKSKQISSLLLNCLIYKYNECLYGTYYLNG